MDLVHTRGDTGDLEAADAEQEEEKVDDNLLGKHSRAS